MSGSGSSSPRVTITQIADELGVTPATVSNAFNRPNQLSPALRERVLETAARLGYRGPDPAARSMRRGRLASLGILYTDRLHYAFDDRAFVLVLKGIALAAEEVHFGLTLMPGAPKQVRDPAAVGAAVVDGFLVYSMADDDPLVAAVLDRHLPVVVIDAPLLPGIPRVGIDDSMAAHGAVQHLLELGHRRFGIIAGELALERRSGPAGPERQDAATFAVNRERLRGYMEALATVGIARDQVPVEEVEGGIEEETRAATRRLLRREPRPTAILAMSDRMALAVLEAARGTGLSVPHDLSVVGFDDIPEASSAVPSLTTVSQPHTEKGLQAGRLLIAQLGRESFPPAVMLPTRLTLRYSTASP
jgi:DNA-binding LacI/PurR family transcriptional regulator